MSISNAERDSWEEHPDDPVVGAPESQSLLTDLCRNDGHERGVEESVCLKASEEYSCDPVVSASESQPLFSELSRHGGHGGGTEVDTSLVDNEQHLLQDYLVPPSSY